MDVFESSVAELDEIARKLSSISLSPDKGLHQPFTRVTYQESLDKDRFQFPEELLSLYHHPIYGELTYEQKWNLALLE